MLGRGSVAPTLIPPFGFVDQKDNVSIPWPVAGDYKFSSVATGLNSVVGVLAGEPVLAVPDATAGTTDGSSTTAAASGSEDGSSDRLSGGVIAGIVVGSLAAAAVLAGGGYVLLRWCQQKWGNMQPPLSSKGEGEEWACLLPACSPVVQP